MLAQIACHDGTLPQGSPCSPVFGNLVAHILDIRLLKLCAQVGCTYSRYADDLTFSTNKKEFPAEIALLSTTDGDPLHVWLPGDPIRSIISDSGFSINDSKTSMMYKRSRQEVTGLVVNREIRPSVEYRRLVRTMVHRLVTTGNFQIYRSVDKGGARVLEKRPGTFDELHGMLGYVDYVRCKNNEILGRGSHNGALSSEEVTYRNFLIYRLFYAAERPTVLCEGDTDNVYLTHAIRSLAADFPDLAEVEANGKINLRIRLYRHPKSNTRRLLQFYDGGSSVLAQFIGQYKKETKNFGPGLRNPVIILFDNDDGGSALRSAIRKVTDQTAPQEFPFLRLLKNLYAVPTPGVSTEMEDFFDPAIKALPLDGKVFHPDEKGFDETLHFGKKVFAHQIVRKNADSISFEGFRPLLNNLSAAIVEHHRSFIDLEAQPAAPD